MSEPINELAKALSVAQGAFQNPLKDGKNPHFNSRYATLDALQDATRKVLSDNGLCVTQLPQPGPDGWELHTMLIHTSGQSLTSRLPLTAFSKGAQAAGGEITYMRRYAYASILNITAEEDDDGNSAQGSAPGREYKLNPLEIIKKHHEASIEAADKAVGELLTGESQKTGRITAVTASADGGCWFVTVAGFSEKGMGNSVWTRDKDLASSLVKEQGNVVHAHLRSKKPGSYQLISYIPEEDGNE
jgi:hypothetical protein